MNAFKAYDIRGVYGRLVGRIGASQMLFRKKGKSLDNELGGLTLSAPESTDTSQIKNT